MKLKIGDSTIKFIGDVHLGRRFINGVPLHRRGEREKMVWVDFVQQLHDVEGCDYCIQVGDIFDRTVVPNRVLLDTANAIARASDENPSVTYVFGMGNHDASRDVTIVSSFHLLCELLVGQERVKFVAGAPEILPVGNILVVPWDPFLTAEMMVSQFGADRRFAAVVGHWDIESFGGDDSNLLPYEALSQYTDTVVTGHVHQPQQFERNGMTVIVTGSMQPYTFAEDPEQKLYRTMTLSQFENTDPATLKDQYVRVMIAHDATAPEEIDCLGFQVKRLGENERDLDVQFETFEFDREFRAAFRESGVGHELTEEYLSAYHESH